MLHRDIEKRQRDRKDRDEERWTEIGYRERKKKTATQETQRWIYREKERKGEKLQIKQRKFHLFLFLFFK